MKALIGNAILIGLAVAAASAAGCSFSAAPSHPGATSATDDNTGSVGLELTLPNGQVISTISYTVNGPNGASTIVTTGTVPVLNSTSIFFQIPANVPVGTGYTMTLTGSDDAGDTCAGTSVPFAVTARTSTQVLVQLQCHGTANGSGAAIVTGTTSNCATWQSINAATSDILGGIADPVVFSATGPDHSNLAYNATVSGAGTAVLSPASGALSTGSTNTGSFNVTCTSPGLVTLTVAFSDGVLPPGGSCDASLSTVSFPIQCEGEAFLDSGIGPDGEGPDTGMNGGGKDSGPDGEIFCSRPDNCTLCGSVTGITTAGCSKTEFAFVQHDPTGGCLKCLVNAGAIDDAIFPDTGHECEDLPAAQQAACFATLDCILNTNVGNDNNSDTKAPTSPTCASAGLNISDCYCGAGVPTSTCAALTAAPTGVCTNVEAAGLGLPSFPTTPVLNAYTNTTLGSGQVNEIFVVAQQNACTSCF